MSYDVVKLRLGPLYRTIDFSLRDHEKVGDQDSNESGLGYSHNRFLIEMRRFVGIQTHSTVPIKLGESKLRRYETRALRASILPSLPAPEVTYWRP